MPHTPFHSGKQENILSLNGTQLDHVFLPGQGDVEEETETLFGAFWGEPCLIYGSRVE